MHFISGDYLVGTPTDNPSPFFLALTIGFGVLFVVSAVVYWRRAKLVRENSVKRRFVRRLAEAGLWTGGIGLFLAAMRYLQVDYLGWPLWMYLLLCSMIGIVAYFVYDASERYPLAVWRLQESHLERRYRPMAKPRSEPQRPRPKTRGKRRK